MSRKSKQAKTRERKIVQSTPIIADIGVSTMLATSGLTGLALSHKAYLKQCKHQLRIAANRGRVFLAKVWGSVDVIEPKQKEDIEYLPRIYEGRGVRVSIPTPRIVWATKLKLTRRGTWRRVKTGVILGGSIQFIGGQHVVVADQLTGLPNKYDPSYYDKTLLRQRNGSSKLVPRGPSYPKNTEFRNLGEIGGLQQKTVFAKPEDALAARERYVSRSIMRMLSLQFDIMQKDANRVCDLQWGKPAMNYPLQVL